MLVEVAKIGDILPGGMKAFDIDGKEIVVCNTGKGYYAFDRRCGHMNAPLDMGTLEGTIVTCPLHSVQFDAVTGEAMTGPLPAYMPGVPPVKSSDNFMRWIGELMQHVKTCDIKIYEVKIDGNIIKVDI
jgi:nitrite reductase/ring-hydroxylating ferredoxin subunit